MDDGPLPQTIQQAFQTKWPRWSEPKLALWVKACDDVQIWDVDDLKLYKDADIEKLEDLSRTLRLALCELRDDLFGDAANSQGNGKIDAANLESADMDSPPTKKPRLADLPTLSASKASNTKKRKNNSIPQNISSFFSSWTRVVKTANGGTVSYNGSSAHVETTPAQSKQECNICHKLFPSALGLRVHRNQWCMPKHDNNVSAPILAIVFRLKEAKSKTPGSCLYLAKYPEYNMPRKAPLSAGEAISLPPAPKLNLLLKVILLRRPTGGVQSRESGTQLQRKYKLWNVPRCVCKRASH